MRAMVVEVRAEIEQLVFEVDRCPEQGESGPGGLPGRPGEFRPEPPTDPDVNLSIHPARATPKKVAAFRQDQGLIRFPVDPISAGVTCPLRSTGITPFHRYYEAVRP
jgi:hypothetical protein